jgi:tryptophan synthase alpha chain
MPASVRRLRASSAHGAADRRRFGVKKQNAAELARNADGVVVGTALVQALKARSTRKAAPDLRALRVTGLVASLAEGVRDARPKGGVMSW